MRKSTTILAAGLAAALSFSLMAAPAVAVGAAAPAAVGDPVTFSSVTISKLKNKITVPKSGKTSTVKFTVSIVGTASDGGVSDINGDGLAVNYGAYDANFYGAKVVKVSSKVKSPTLPRVIAPTRVAPGSNTYALSIPYYTSPGYYEVQVPVTQKNWTASPYPSVSKIATYRFQVLANTSISRASTSAYAPSWKKGKTAKITITAPAYQRGAKVTMYYKKNGAKKYTKITSAKLKATKNGYTTKVTLKTKKLTRTGKVYFKVSAVKYAKAYKTSTAKITVR